MWTRRDALAGLGAAGALALPQAASAKRPVVFEVFDGRASAALEDGAELETLADGFTWSEGPTWDRVRQRLYFTDVPGNVAYSWSEEEGLSTFLDPSGVAASGAQGLREAGANGLWFGADGQLYLCNHGERAVQRMDVETKARETLAGAFEGQRFNSPNDLVRAADGTIYFTDPPYGLEGLNASPLKEMTANGVYRLAPDGAVERLFDELTFPNGIALSPDERWLYVAQSDPEAPHIFRAPLREGRPAGPLKRIFDASAFLAAGDPGLPDGMAVSAAGTLFATGPGGVLVLSPDGDLLARILTGRATANCAFGGADGRDLYITANDRLMRARVAERGVQWTV